MKSEKTQHLKFNLNQKVFKLLVSSYIVFHFYFASLNADSISITYIPAYQSEALKVISFTTTRSLIDGALKSDLLQMLKSHFNIEVFIESGTYLGNTTFYAADLFNEIHTIELSADLFYKAKERFKEKENVFIYQGDSSEILHTLLPKISSRILFYLDGHYSGGNTAQGSSNTPIMRELQAIRDSNKGNAVILIDDIRCFQDSHSPEKILNTHLEGYPDLRQLTHALLEINSDYLICFLGDALLAFPNDSNVSASPVVRACAIQRFASVFHTFPEDLLQETDSLIKNIQGEEKDEMILYYKTYSSFELENGFRSFGTFWLGLIRSGEGNEQEAKHLYEQAAANSPSGWRAHQFK